MKRVGNKSGHLAVGLDRSVNVEGFERDLDEIEVEVLEDADLPKSGGNHVVDDGVFVVIGLTLGEHVDAIPVSGEAARFADASDWGQAAEVDANPNRHGASLSLPDDRFDFLTIADIARVESQAVYAALQRLERQLVVEVNVCYQRDVNLPFDVGEGFGGLHVGHSRAYDLAACIFKLPDLCDCGGDVPGVSLGHGLDRDRSISADLDVADLEGFGYAASDHFTNAPDCGANLYAESTAL